MPTSKIFCRMFLKAKRLVLLNTNKVWPCFVSAFYVPFFFLIWMWSFFVADIDGLGLDVPPGSPSSVRSSGDGSSCDTPPVNQCTSSTDDGRTDRGKYCDCCYCEFFGHAAVSRLFTSNLVWFLRTRFETERWIKSWPKYFCVGLKWVNRESGSDRSTNILLRALHTCHPLLTGVVLISG